MPLIFFVLFYITRVHVQCRLKKPLKCYNWHWSNSLGFYFFISVSKEKNVCLQKMFRQRLVSVFKTNDNRNFRTKSTLNAHAQIRTRSGAPCFTAPTTYTLLIVLNGSVCSFEFAIAILVCCLHANQLDNSFTSSRLQCDAKPGLCTTNYLNASGEIQDQLVFPFVSSYYYAWYIVGDDLYVCTWTIVGANEIPSLLSFVPCLFKNGKALSEYVEKTWKIRQNKIIQVIKSVTHEIKIIERELQFKL